MLGKTKKLLVQFGPEFTLLAGSKAIALFATLFTLKIVSTNVSVEQMAILGLILAFANGASRLLFSPLTQSAIRMTSPFREQTLGDQFSKSLGVLYRRRLLIIFICAFSVAFFIEISSSAIALGAVLAVVQGLNVINMGQLTGLRMRGLMAITSIANSLARLVFVSALSVASLAKPATVALAYISATLVAIFIQFSFSHRRKISHVSHYLYVRNGSNIDREVLTKTQSYALPFIFMMGIDMLIFEADKYIFANYLTLEALGLYFAVQQVAKSIPLFVIGIVEQFFYPIFFQKRNKLNANDLTRKAILQSVLAFILVVTPILVLTFFVSFYAEPIMGLLTAEKFIPAAPLLPYLIAGYVLTQSARVLQISGLSTLNSSQFILPKLLQVFVFFSAAIYLLEEHGILAIGYGLLISSIALVSCLLINNARLYKNCSD